MKKRFGTYREEERDQQSSSLVRDFGGQKVRTVSLENRVLWVNPLFIDKLPFDIRKGERLPWLGYVVPPQSTFRKRLGKLVPSLSPSVDLGLSAVIFPNHNRSSSFPYEITFEDIYGRRYHHIDLKGNANVLETEQGLTPHGANLREMIGKTYLGVAGDVFAAMDVNNVGIFNHIGIRTYQIVALITLQELLLDNGKRVPINKVSKKFTEHNYDPVVVMRAYPLKFRVKDLDLKTGKKKVDRTIQVLHEEGFPNRSTPFTYLEYQNWFCRTLGEQIGKMHHHQLCHYFLHAQNITLDCRIVDLDSVANVEAGRWNQSYRRDYLKTLETLRIFVGNLSQIRDMPTLSHAQAEELFTKAYLRANPNAPSTPTSPL